MIPLRGLSRGAACAGAAGRPPWLSALPQSLQ
jgi:hypothetical protein